MNPNYPVPKIPQRDSSTYAVWIFARYSSVVSSRVCFCTKLKSSIRGSLTSAGSATHSSHSHCAADTRGRAWRHLFRSSGLPRQA